MDILYIGVQSGTSYHRAKALERAGHKVTVFSPRRQVVSLVPGLSESGLKRWIRFTGSLFLERLFLRTIRRSPVWRESFDLVHVDDIAVAGPSFVSAMKQRFGGISCYVIDDPFGERDGPKWRLFLNAVPEYDLITVIRKPNVQEAYDYGATNVLRTFRSADEEVHAPIDMTPEERENWRSDVIFVGTWFPERGPFMKRLVDRGVPLTIRGDHWKKADEWSTLKQYWEGPAVYGKDYTRALQSAKICLGLLSHENRDLHTTRSLEIPYIGSLFCAERTKEHLDLYEEGQEAVFWDDADECTDICFELLDDRERRQRTATQGRQRCIQNGYLNENVMTEIVERTSVVAPA